MIIANVASYHLIRSQLVSFPPGQLHGTKRKETKNKEIYSHFDYLETISGMININHHT